MNNRFSIGPGTVARVSAVGVLRSVPRRLALLLALIATPAIPAAMLTFDGAICSGLADGSGAVTACASGGAYINQAYGDTATINLTYSSPVSAFSLQVWRAVDNAAQFQYSDLSDVAFGTFGTSMLSITLQPLGGTGATLNSFNLGTFPNTVTREATVNVTDLATNTVVFTLALTTANGNPIGSTASLVSPGVSSLVGLRLDVVTADPSVVGIDNVNFDNSAPPSGVPEPATLSLVGLTLAGIAVSRAKMSKFN